jgi:hypothetical protein
MYLQGVRGGGSKGKEGGTSVLHTSTGGGCVLVYRNPGARHRARHRSQLQKHQTQNFPQPPHDKRQYPARCKPPPSHPRPHTATPTPAVHPLMVYGGLPLSLPCLAQPLMTPQLPTDPHLTPPGCSHCVPAPVRCVEVLCECACLLRLEPVGGALRLQCGAQQVLHGPRLVLQLHSKVNGLRLLQGCGGGWWGMLKVELGLDLQRDSRDCVSGRPDTGAGEVWVLLM